MTAEPTKAYGEGRVRVGISYAEVERAAIALLKSERRPTVETIREALGTGSPDTIATALKRFWRDLGARMEGDPVALTRLPPDIADLADGIWQRALKLAGQAAQHDDNAARERLKQLEVENEIRSHSLSLREREWDVAARERERALADAREHLLLLSRNLGVHQATMQARDARIADLELQLQQSRQHLTALIAGPLAKRPPSHQGAAPKQPTSRALSRKPNPSSRQPAKRAGAKRPLKTQQTKTCSPPRRSKAYRRKSR